MTNTTTTTTTKAINAAISAILITDHGFQYVREYDDCELDLEVQIATIMAAAGAALAKCGISKEEIPAYIKTAINACRREISGGSSEAMKTIYRSLHN